MNSITALFGWECAQSIGLFMLAIIFILLIIVITMIVALYKCVKFLYGSVINVNSSIDNMSQASKRIERMCDAINQRTRSQCNQSKKKEINKKPDNNRNKRNLNKGQRRNYEKSNKGTSDLFSVRNVDNK
jgi:hypothetical protein